MKFNKVLDGLLYHPNSVSFKEALKQCGPHERKCLAELWLSEGIPVAFVKFPTEYQILRIKLAESLKVGVKDVSLVGSGRLGFSLAPRKYGEPFGEGSDLDICVINPDLFERLVRDAKKFIDEFHAGEVKPSSEYERGFWSNNVSLLKQNSDKGFIDSKYVPNYPVRYKEIFLANNAVSSMNLRIHSLPGMPMLKKSTVRVYKDWASMSKQVSMNLELLSNKLSGQ